MPRRVVCGKVNDACRHEAARFAQQKAEGVYQTGEARPASIGRRRTLPRTLYIYPWYIGMFEFNAILSAYGTPASDLKDENHNLYRTMHLP